MLSVSFSENCLHSDVLCISSYLKYTLAGIGGRLFVYVDKSLLLSKRIFTDERIHAVYVSKDLVALKGIKKLCVTRPACENGVVEFKVVLEKTCNDWIQDLVFLQDDLIGINTAHNSFQLWELKTGNCLEKVNCMENCLLYSCKVIGSSKGSLLVFSGTVFGEVQVWAPFWGSEVSDSVVPLHKFKGHDGAVFSIEVNTSSNIICTTSDDRSLKIWKVIFKNPPGNICDWKAAQIVLTHTSYTHTARVWRSLIISDFFVTIGEDSKLAVWRNDGTLIKSLDLHRGGGIRALHYSKERNFVVTGGEDGGINAIRFDWLLSESCPKKILDLNDNFSTAVSFIRDGLVYTQNEGCVCVFDDGLRTCYSDKLLENYCVLEVSENKHFIFLGSIDGHLIVIETKTKSVILKKKCSEGRIYSIQWLRDCVLTCGPEGILDLWEFKVGSVNHLKKMILPACKERWTTCGVLLNDHLFVGDRMGNIHVFDVRIGGNPVQTHRKIHKHLGVTDVAIFGKSVLSVGRDGTAKVFTHNLQHALTHKLPMEWPKKIITYKNDTLILGFHSVSLVVFSMNCGEIISSYDCGGGHRSCDFKINNNVLSFVYVKQKKIYTVELSLDQIVRVRNGFHSKEINSLKVIPSEPPIVITGGEDTTLRISLVAESDLREIKVLKTHTSSIRSIAVVSVSPSSSIFVSGGCKGQMIAWMFNTETLTCQKIASHYFKESKKNWKSSVLDIDTDVRIMSVDVIKTKEDILVVVGSSDGKINLFTLDDKKLTLMFTYSWNCCILKVLILEVNSKVMVVGGGTDGGLLFFRINIKSSDFDFMTLRDLHESGINSLKIQELDNETFLLATGGDDNKVKLSLVRITESCISILNSWFSNTTHSSQVTGIEIIKNLILTASIDQRVTVWQWSVDKFKLQVEYKNQYMTSVPDVQGLQAEWKDDGKILVFLHGKGMEKVEVDVAEVTSTEPASRWNVCNNNLTQQAKSKKIVQWPRKS